MELPVLCSTKGYELSSLQETAVNMVTPVTIEEEKRGYEQPLLCKLKQHLRSKQKWLLNELHP